MRTRKDLYKPFAETFKTIQIFLGLYLAFLNVYVRPELLSIVGACLGLVQPLQTVSTIYLAALFSHPESFIYYPLLYHFLSALKTSPY